MGMKVLRNSCLVCLVVCLLPSLALATVHVVRQDGTGDFLTIAAAYAAASNGDTIDVGPGTYTDSLYVTKRLAFIGSSGPDVTILSGEGAHRIMVFQSGSSGSTASGFTFTRGMGNNGGAVRVQDGAEVHISNCVFKDNTTTYDGGGFYVRFAGSHLTIEDCSFSGNHTGHNGAAGNVVDYGSLDVARCVFHNNSTDIVSGALAAHYSTMNVSGCLFYGNTSGDVAGAIYFYESQGSVRSSTFDGNSSPGLLAGTVFIDGSPPVVVERNIITGAGGSCGLYDRYSHMPHSCNLFWGNAAGPVGGDAALDPSEVVADPLYCDSPAVKYSIANGSPAAPGHNTCGVLMGAYEVGCEGGELPCTHNRIRVRQDGTGDFLTIAAAMAAANNCDTIDVGPGMYVDSLYITKRLAFIGSSGPDVTILSGEGAHRIMVFKAGAAPSSASGFTFTHGHGNNGGAVRVQDGAEVHISNCVFKDNTTTYDGGGFYVRFAGSHLTIEDCSFSGNHTAHNGAAGNVVDYGSLDVARCVFHNNSTDIVSGALAAHYSTMNVSGCLFYGNTSGDVAGAIYFYISQGSVRSSTFDGNSSPGLAAGTILIHYSPEVVVERNIITNAQSGYGLYDLSSFMPHSCNLFWGNAAGPTGGDAVLDSSEVVGEPMYCGAQTANYSIAYESPAAPGNNTCGVLIGALAPACYEQIATLLQSYSASRENNSVVVRWTLAEGSDVPDFEIARATDGVDFVTIANAPITSRGRSYSFIDTQTEPGKSYRYRIEYRTADVTHQLFETEAVKIPTMPLTLFQNYPNPFNPATTIKFYLPEAENVALDVFDVSGRRIASLASGHMDAGHHAIEWHGTNDRGSRVASGTYLYHLKAGKKELVRKMIMLR